MDDLTTDKYVLNFHVIRFIPWENAVKIVPKYAVIAKIREKNSHNYIIFCKNVYHKFKIVTQKKL